MKPLLFERVRIHRMPGVGGGGFELPDLSPGLNVVHGPNASGKTTTARAVEALVWPRAAAPERAWLSGAFRLGEEGWTVEVDTGRARYQREGGEAPAPTLPPAESRDRYRLSLDDLLAADDAGLARAIARESAGGYDLAAAAQLLRPRTSASRATSEVEALRAARARLQEARGAQQALHAEERRLEEMERQLAARADLTDGLRLLDRAIEHAAARGELEAARSEREAFPAGMERVRGDEAEALGSLRERLRAARGAAREAEGRLQGAQEGLDRLGLSGASLRGELLPTLRSDLQALHDREREVAAQEQKLREAHARRERERRAVSGAVDEARLAALDTAGVEEIGELARAAEVLRAEREGLRAQLRWLASDGEEAHARQTLERGARLLQQWLRCAPPDARREQRLRTLGSLAAAGLVAAGLLLVLVTPFLAVLAAAGAFLLLQIRRKEREADPRPMQQKEYGALGLEAPAAWTSEAVGARLERLEGQIARASHEEERGRRRAEVERRVPELAAREESLAARRAEAARRLGVDLDVHEEHLFWLVERVGRWQGAHGEAEGASAALESAREQFARTLQQANGRLVAIGREAVADRASLEGAVDDLERRRQEHRDAEAALRAAQDDRERAGGDIQELERSRRELLGRLGLGEEDEATVEAWCAEHHRYADACERHRVAEARRKEIAGRLETMPGFEAGILERDAALLEEERGRTEAELAGLERVREEATRLRTLMDQARRGRAVEDALAEVARREAALDEARSRDLRSGVAAVLVDFVQRSTRDQHLPEVFHRARTIFAQITHGRHRLDFTDGEAPAFRAYDTTSDTGHALEELSSATRIQLLLAVRLAFVETQETGVRLPILLDETLGNSDDHRARAIMEAVLELAAGGRQVFYFTAQPGEVGRWRSLLEERPEVPARIVDLAEVRRLARPLDLQGLRVVGPPERSIPAPGDLSHEEYGAALQVPALPAGSPVGALHLWYLLEDTHALFRILDVLGVQRWGALQALVQHGGGGLVDEDLFLRLGAAARAAGTALELRRVGRGRTVDRSVLVDSGAVTDTFLDRVDELCRTLGGNARRLLAALEEGRISRFRQSSAEELREYLEAGGYLDLREPVDAPLIRVRTLAAVAPELDRGLLAVDQVDRLLARVGVSLPEPRPAALA